MRQSISVLTAFLLVFICVVSVMEAGAQDGQPHERYDFLIAKGTYLYSTHQYAEAQRILNEALTLRPGDPTAGYYLGRTLIRQGNYDAAEARFRDVLRQHPDDPRARMGLGMALYHQGRYADALTDLSAAEPRLTDEPAVYYYQGLAAAGLRQFKTAGEKFQRAGSLDREYAQDAHYQRGVSFFGQGKLEDASDEFRAAAAGEAGRGARPVSPGPMGADPGLAKRWDLTAALSFQYDSNVVLLPSGVQPPGGATGISRQDDFVTVLSGRGEYRFLQNDTWTVGAGYGFFQNIHARLSEFDVQTHTPTLYAQRRLGSATVRFQYLLDYVTVGGDSYLLSNALQSVVTLPQSDRTYTQAFVRYQNKNFMDWDLDRAGVNQTRDANNWMVGAIQFLTWSEGRGHVRGGYIFDTDRTGGGSVDRAQPGRPSSADWSYTGHRFTTGIGYRPATATTLDLAFDYYRQGYDNPNSFSLDGTTVRRDNIFQLTGTAMHDLRSWLWVGFQYSFTRDDANIAAFSYVRHVISFTIGGRF